MRRFVSHPQASIPSAEGLLRCPLFRGLDRSIVGKINPIATLRTVNKLQYLFYEGMQVNAFYVLQTGAIKVSRVSLMGKEQVMKICRPFEALADDALLSETGYPADACAVERSTVWRIPKAEFLSLVQQFPELSFRLLRSACEHVVGLMRLVDDLTLKDAKTRLAHWLIEHCPNPESAEPQRVHFPMSKRILASELGTTSETFSRTLAKLRDQDLLSVEGRTVILRCPAKLAKLVNRCFAEPAPAASGDLCRVG